MDLEIFLLIAFIGISISLILRDRKNVEFKYIVLIRRTKRFKKKIDEIVKKYGKVIKIYSLIAIFISIAASLFGVYMLIQNLYFSILHPQEAIPSVGMILPQVPGVEYPFPYIIGVPVSYWIISILTILLSHEFSHALVARAEKIKLKSFGIFLLLIFPGAFVEPDEEQLKKSKILTRLKVYSVGSFGNFFNVLIFLIISFLLFKAVLFFLEPIGIEYEIIENTPASQAGLTGTILSVNEIRTRNIYEFVNVMKSVEPGETVKIQTTYKTYEIKTINHPDNPELPYIGISFKRNKVEFKENFNFLGKPSSLLIDFLEWLFGSPLFTPFNPGLFSWIIILNLLVGIFNVLPIKPLDGGFIYEAIFEKFLSKNNSKRLVNLFSAFVIFIILINIAISLT
ncbi:MAG: site-2 protease family protein [Candidatus Aenigmatarchaeota archaeon]